MGDRIIVSVSGGKDSVATALHLLELGHEFDMVFMDTGWEHPDLYAHLDYLERVLGRIHRDEAIGVHDLCDFASRLIRRLHGKWPLDFRREQRGILGDKIQRISLYRSPVRDSGIGILVAHKATLRACLSQRSIGHAVFVGIEIQRVGEWATGHSALHYNSFGQLQGNTSMSELRPALSIAHPDPTSD